MYGLLSLNNCLLELLEMFIWILHTFWSIWSTQLQWAQTATRQKSQSRPPCPMITASALVGETWHDRFVICTVLPWSPGTAKSSVGDAYLEPWAGWMLRKNRSERQRSCRRTSQRLSLRDLWWSEIVLELPLCPSGMCRERSLRTGGGKRGWWFHSALSLWNPTEPVSRCLSPVLEWICTARRRRAGDIQSLSPQVWFSVPEKLAQKNRNHNFQPFCCEVLTLI